MAGGSSPRSTLRKAVRLLLFIAVSLGMALLIRATGRTLPRLRRDRNRLAFLRLWAKAVWRIIGLRVEISGKFPPGGPFLVVSNHLGYLDIAVLSGVLPVTFVSKSEVRSWPFIGFLARSAGTIFVAREDRRQTKDFVNQVAGRLAEGKNVHVFPEGTSSRGETILPFKTAAFASASSVPGSRILPVRIDLLEVGGETADGGVRDVACWHDDMEFAPHFWKFLGSGGGRFRVMIGKPVRPESLDRKILARIAREQVIDLGKGAGRCRTLLPGGWNGSIRFHEGRQVAARPSPFRYTTVYNGSRTALPGRNVEQIHPDR